MAPLKSLPEKVDLESMSSALHVRLNLRFLLA